MSDPLGPSFSDEDLFIWSSNQLNNDDYVTGSVWPKPQSDSPTGDTFALASTNFKFNSVGESSDVLSAALLRYMNLTFPDDVSQTKPGLKEITELAVKVINKYEPLSLETDESCKLRNILNVCLFLHHVLKSAKRPVCSILRVLCCIYKLGSRSNIKFTTPGNLRQTLNANGNIYISVLHGNDYSKLALTFSTEGNF